MVHMYDAAHVLRRGRHCSLAHMLYQRLIEERTPDNIARDTTLHVTQILHFAAWIAMTINTMTLVAK